MEWVYQLFPRLKERSWQFAGTLSGVEEVMANPQVREAYLGKKK